MSALPRFSRGRWCCRPSFGKRRAMMIVMMGVSGSGKSTVGRALAARLGVPFREGDDLHPAANIDKMRHGIALDDDDRAPWLDAVAGWIAANGAGGGVVSCSALKRRYRDVLRAAGAPSLGFVLLRVDAAAAHRRLADRPGHFMPESLIDSQLRTLEPPVAEDDIVVCDATRSVAEIVADIVEWIGAGTR